MLAPERQKVYLSWFCGWIATLGWLANTATGAFFVATMIQGTLIQNDSDEYTGQRWHGTLLMWAVLLLAFIINALGTKLLSVAEGFVMFIHLAAFPGILVPLLYFSPHGSAQDVFVTFTNTGGWKSNGLAWFVGLISANLPLIGYDGPTHITEEVVNAASVVPWSMVGSVALNGVLGWAVVIAFSFCIVPTLDESLTSPTGYDFIDVFYRAVGPAGSAGMTATLIILMWCATLGFLATSTRQTWAFARDRGLPFSPFFSFVDSFLVIPLRTLALCTVIPCLLALINIGSTVAFNAFVSITEAGLFLSYLIPISLIMIRKIRREQLNYGPWQMGSFGLAVNAFSVVYLVISTFFSFFPPAVPVTAMSMNWSVAVFGGFVLIGFLWFAIWGRRQYEGPRVDTEISRGSLKT